MSPITVIAILIAVVLTAVISVFATIAYRKSVIRSESRKCGGKGKRDS